MLNLGVAHPPSSARKDGDSSGCGRRRIPNRQRINRGCLPFACVHPELRHPWVPSAGRCMHLMWVVRPSVRPPPVFTGRNAHGRASSQAYGVLFFFIYILFNTCIHLFIYLWLCWVFVSVRGLSLVAASGGHSSSRCAGLFTIVASLVAEHRLQTRRLSSCASRA